VIDETDSGYIRVFCERCGMDGAQVAYGWAVLCSQCKSLDDREWEDE